MRGRMWGRIWGRMLRPMWGQFYCSCMPPSALLQSTGIYATTVKVAADWASDSASDWAADWASDSTHSNRSKVHCEKLYFQSFLRYFSLQISVDLSNTTYLFIAKRKLGKRARLWEKWEFKDTAYYVSISLNSMIEHILNRETLPRWHPWGTEKKNSLVFLVLFSLL